MVKYYGRARQRIGSVNTNQLGLKMSGCPSKVGRNPTNVRYIQNRVNCMNGICGIPLQNGAPWRVSPFRNLNTKYCKPASSKCLAAAGGIGNIYTPYFKTNAPGTKGCGLRTVRQGGAVAGIAEGAGSLSSCTAGSTNWISAKTGDLAGTGFTASACNPGGAELGLGVGPTASNFIVGTTPSLASVGVKALYFDACPGGCFASTLHVYFTNRPDLATLPAGTALISMANPLTGEITIFSVASPPLGSPTNPYYQLLPLGTTNIFNELPMQGCGNSEKKYCAQVLQ